MKRRPRKEPTTIAQMRPVTLFLMLCGCILLVFGLINFNGLMKGVRRVTAALSPIAAGAVIAYLLNPAVNFLEDKLKRLLKKPAQKHPSLNSLPRAVASVLSVLLFIGAISLLVFISYAEVAESLSSAISSIPAYLDELTERAGKLLTGDNVISKALNRIYENFSETALGSGKLDPVDITQKILTAVASGAAGTLGVVYSLVIGVVVAVYLLSSKDRFIRQFKQVLYAVCKPTAARWIDTQMTKANETFGTAVLGKMTDSVIIGLLCFIGTTIMQMPYAAMISVIVGVMNVIPYFGPIFGAIPCFLLVLMENPVKSLYFLIFIVILQQFDANILDPRIVGASIGLPAFWELFACLLGGGLFGIAGLIIGVPLFAVIYKIIRQLVTERLAERAEDGELEKSFLRETLGITEPVEVSGLLVSDSDVDGNIDSPYVQKLVLLEDIAQTPRSAAPGVPVPLDHPPVGGQ